MSFNKDKKVREEERREDKLEEKRVSRQEDVLEAKRLGEKASLEKAIKEDEKKSTLVAKPLVAKPIPPPKPVTVINDTKTIYDLTLDGIPYHIVPGENKIASEEIALSLVKDMNKACIGEDNNPFSIRK